MNDPQIRKAFHRTVLRKYRNSASTLVVNELGLEHGKCRADIAVINGKMIGYEIKSDVDSLKRLRLQIDTYDAVFDNSSIVLTKRHIDEVMNILPSWWGVILAEDMASGNIQFKYLRHPRLNANTNDYSIAQLLWRNEAQEILMKLGIQGPQLRKSRALLYQDIIELLTPSALRRKVRKYLKKRRVLRDRVLPFLNGGSSQLQGIGIDSRV
jgi:hypothetical protein